ncbi:FecCD family ABC transporter permease [Paenibacillus hamazuiensis]|uniref:FecCD family ABC transporter permease n=1 Tax=Paenibacillus hamazuiensis TaxID=2936508 RepID=UPI00200DA7B1|nr:iron ABC transporter permease [Paenibacillus hamazuiensis]
MSKYSTFRGRAFSYLVSKKVIGITLLLLAANAAVAVISTGIGSVFIHPLDVVKTLLGGGTDTNAMIIFKLRLPRIVTALLVGSSLAVAGAVLQGMIRNPLASPDTVGITGGAVLGAVSFFFFGAGKAPIDLLPLCAIIGALAITAIIYTFAWKRGVSPLRLVLIGIGFASALSAVTYMLLISGPLVLAAKSLTFMTGSIYGVSWEKDVITLLPWVAVLLPLTLLQARNVNLQELGDDVGTGLGGRIQGQRALLLLLSVGLAGAAVSIGGAIGFIGLMAPHLARKLVGPAFGGVLPVGALCGSLILLLADLVARSAFAPLDIPAGVFTAAIGAPFFVYLLYRQQRT